MHGGVISFSGRLTSTHCGSSSWARVHQASSVEAFLTMLGFRERCCPYAVPSSRLSALILDSKTPARAKTDAPGEAISANANASRQRRLSMLYAADMLHVWRRSTDVRKTRCLISRVCGGFHSSLQRRLVMANRVMS